jgi:hypothetical protein
VGVYFTQFRYIDLSHGCNITIHPGWLELNNKNIVEALRVLKHGSPSDYRAVCRNITDIYPAMSCGGWQGGCYYGTLGEIYLSTTNDEFIGSTAMIIVHETCHDMQRREGREASEEECYEMGDATLQTIVQL